MALINQNSIIGVTSITSPSSSNVLTVHANDTTERLRVSETGLSFSGTNSSLDTSGNATFNGNVSIGGTLTYEDVTNIDSVGIITAQSGIHVTAGNVGIGTDNPAGTLEISAASTTDMIMLDAAGTNFARLGHNSASGTDLLDVRSEGHTRFLTNGNNERLRIASNGSVGINTTLTSGALTVNIAGDYKTSTQNVADEGLIFQSFTTASTGDVYPGISWTGNPGALGRARASINAISTNDNNGSDIVFLTRNAADGTELEVTNDEKLRITSAGNVGIGTENPLNGLDILQSEGRLRFNRFSHLLMQNQNNSTTNYWGISSRNGGELDIGYGTPDSNSLIGGDVLTLNTDGHGEFSNGAITRVLIADDVSMDNETTKSFPVDGSGITFPSWATKITVVFYEISMSGTANIIVQLNSGGSPITSNYSSGSANDTGSTNNTSTTGFVVINTNSSHVTSGRMVIERVGTDTKWVSSHTMVQNGTTPRHGAGRLSSYSGTIDGITVLDTGSNSFDGGTITVYAEA